MDGYIRLGVIADNAGHFYELMVPLAIGAVSRRLQREKEYCLNHGQVLGQLRERIPREGVLQVKLRFHPSPALSVPSPTEKLPNQDCYGLGLSSSRK
jgi:hypothetical protein